MKKFSKSTVFLVWAAWLAPGIGVAGDVVKVNLDAAVRQYCHVLRFTSGWQMPKSVAEENGKLYFPLKFALHDDFEFRIRGTPSTRFLVRGVETINNKYYTSNIYEVDFSDPAGVAQPASEQEWNSATVFTLPRDTWAEGEMLLKKLSKNANFRSLESMKSGPKGEGMAMSPDRDFLVLESWSGKLASNGGSDVPLGFSLSWPFDWNHGKLFFDLYDVNSAKKLFTLTAKFSSIYPEEAFRKTIWVTERYFLIPLDERRERCLICEFGRKP